MSVKVAVRVRPFNAKELENPQSSCVSMEGNSTILNDPKTSGTREFHFDYSFWSHDGFHENSDGLLVPDGDKYADQKKVFSCLGKEVLDNAWEGYHCCLFAYGQTGSGKSYSMIGYGPNKGIVPVVCEEIFKGTSKNDNANRTFEISFSMLEIYNEKVQDLLLPISQRPKGGLKVREHTTMGVYVENLSIHAVESFADIEAKMEDGNRNRTIASTMMNASSSRAHTIITIEFKQITKISDAKTTVKTSKINLVDLAGSEKVAKTQATGTRLKEGCAINKSLTVLGIVISTLAEKAMGKAKNAVVPYRDSSLTRILQNALGGNSKTLMICAISPSAMNYEETLSTLRYADQAKKIKLNAVVNESDQDKLIRELRGENERLKDLLKSFENNPKEIIVNSKEEEELRNKLKDLEEQLDENNKFIVEQERTYKEKLDEARKAKATETFDYSKAFIMNLNEDPLLNGKVKFSLAKKKNIIIGRKTLVPPPDIVLGGIGIQEIHARILVEENNYFLKPETEEGGEFLFLNGVNVFQPQKLNHNDRLIFGSSTVFLVIFPMEELNPKFDYEFAQSELMQRIQDTRKQREAQKAQERAAEMENRIREIEERLQREKDETAAQMRKKEAEYLNIIKKMEQSLELVKFLIKKEQEKLMSSKKVAFHEQQTQMLKKNFEKLEAEQEEMKERRRTMIRKESRMEQERVFFEKKIEKYLIKIAEVNWIASELKMKILLIPKMHSPAIAENEEKEDYDILKAKPKLYIRVNRPQKG